MNFLLFKKEFRLGVVLFIVFGLFLYTVNQTSEQIVFSFTKEQFFYYKPAFLKTMYIVMGAVIFALLIVLNRNNTVETEAKRNAFVSFISWTVFSFFPGWIFHLYFIIQTVKQKGSFMALEDQFWIYYAHDITLFLGFSLAGYFILRPVIHEGQ